MYRRSFAALFLFASLLSCGFASAQTKEEIQAQIDDRTTKIQQLEAEIAKVQQDLDATSKDKQTLQTAVKTLDLSRKQVTTSITLTQTKIKQKDTEIKGLASNITTTGKHINDQQNAIGQSLRELDSEESDGKLAMSLLSGQNIGDFFANLNSAGLLRTALGGHVQQLSVLKTTLQTNKTTAEQKRAQLAELKSQLAEQQQQLDITRQQKADLLNTTKNKESAYQALLKQKQEARAQFEADLLDFQSKLNIALDPSSIPHTGTGVLSWPVAKPVITQYFGNTEFATKNPQIYNGHGHSGIDLRATVGTPIMAALSGEVLGTGNTDLTCPGASYGKWVLVKHENGLSTLYAHLSNILVSQGQKVNTGDTVGLSGSTGYATGPHLHFTVFATQGMRIQQLASKSPVCKGKIYTMPVADLKAYLNPLSFL